jgi:hypothetical protein
MAWMEEEVKVELGWRREDVGRCGASTPRLWVLGGSMFSLQDPAESSSNLIDREGATVLV